VRTSTLYRQASDPRDDRPSADPHGSIPLTSKDEAAGRDPVLAARSDLWSKPTDPAGVWSGTASYRFRRFPVTVEFAKSGREWKGWITSAALDMERVPLENIRADARTPSFDMSSPLGVALPISVWLGGDETVGSGETLGRTLQVFARKGKWGDPRRAEPEGRSRFRPSGLTRLGTSDRVAIRYAERCPLVRVIGAGGAAQSPDTEPEVRGCGGLSTLSLPC